MSFQELIGFKSQVSPLVSVLAVSSDWRTKGLDDPLVSSGHHGINPTQRFVLLVNQVDGFYEDPHKVNVTVPMDHHHLSFSGAEKAKHLEAHLWSEIPCCTFIRAHLGTALDSGCLLYVNCSTMLFVFHGRSSFSLLFLVCFHLNLFLFLFFEIDCVALAVL